MNDTWVLWLPRSLRQRLHGRARLQRVISNTGWLMADKVLRMGVGLFVSVWVARYLGPQQFGLLSYAAALAALFGVLAGLGLDGIVVRDLVQNPGDRDRLLGTAFMLKLVAGIGAFLLSLAAATLLRPDDALTLWLVGIIAAGSIFQAFDAIDFWFQSRVESRYVVYARNAAFLTAAVAKVCLILAEAPLIAFAAVALAEIALGAGGLVMAYRWQRLPLWSWRPTVRRAIQLIRESWPLVLSGLAIVVYMKIDQVMLGEMLGDKAVGLYAAATRVSEIWYFIPTAIISSVSPAIIQAKVNNPRLYEERIARLLRLMVLLALSIAVPVTFLADRLIETVFGSDFAGAGDVLAIHMWSAVFVFVGVAQGPWVLNEGLTRFQMRRTVLGVLINVGLNLVFIPAYGIVGAAIATLISQLVVVFISNLLSSKTRPMFFMTLRALTLRSLA
jgi:PST family polysaccharide transporter